MLTVIFGEHRAARLEYWRLFNEHYKDVPAYDTLAFNLGTWGYQHLHSTESYPADVYLKNLENVTTAMKGGARLFWEFPEMLLSPRDQINIAEALWKLHLERCEIVLVTHSYMIVKWLGISTEYLYPNTNRPSPVTFMCCENGEVREATQAIEVLGFCEMTQTAIDLYDREVELAWKKT